MYPPRPKVTLIHKPSGITASSDCRRSDRENHQVALKLLKSRLWMSQQISINADDIVEEYFEPGE